MRRLGLALGTLGGLLALCDPIPAEVILGLSSGSSRIVSADFDGDDQGIRIFGGYRWQPYLGVEAQYADLGEMDDRIDGHDARVEIQSLDFYVVGALPFRTVEFFAKAGCAYSDVEVETDPGVPGDPELESELEDDGLDIAYGIGAALRLRSYLSVRGEIERFVIEGTDEVELVSFGLDIRF